MSLGRRHHTLPIGLLPKESKRSRGDELPAVFDEMRADLGTNPGPVGKSRLYARLTVDLLRQIPTERARVGRRNRVVSKRPNEPTMFPRAG